MADMTDTRCYSKAFLTEFIQLYKSLPTLWKVKSKEYSDRAKKNAAYAKLIAKLKEVEPDANRELATKKINSLRSSHRKERKKIVASKRSGAESVYVPNLWYYDLLQFVVDQDTPRRMVSNFDDRPQSQTVKANKGSMASPPGTSYSTSEEAYSPPEIRAPKRKNQRQLDREPDSVIPSVGKRLCECKNEDQHDSFGRNIANKLRNLPNDQRIYLEKLINDAAFEAELGNLSRDCYVFVPSMESTETMELQVKEEI